ncbi:hypothetical protein LOC67_20475 [Stieleria sp. JC731]|uniref:hypothetical protein n=1 Tax=Pirellulaceae TaxID=2691357 RepID=UPI001E4CF4C5|nr:hypothetical protein [Stieleria sp. JC731]MCC9602932.1 hypothetical protein [Stieleria sp. JC731]
MEGRLRPLMGLLFSLLISVASAIACEKCGRPTNCPTGACQTKSPVPNAPTPTRRSSLLGQLRPNRVLIVTCLDRQDRLREQTELMHQLATHLRRQSTVEVVESDHRMCLQHSPMQTGRFDERQLVEMGTRYSADTVIYCEIANIDSYRPMKLELRFLMVSTHQSIALASASRHHDLGHTPTRKQFLSTFDPYEHSAESLLRSPSRLIDFSANKLAAELLRL